MANVVRRRDLSQPAFTTTRNEWDPFRMMRELMRVDPYEAAHYEQPRGAFVPLFDVRETRDGYEFRADMPGVREGDVDIAVTGKRLTVSGHREAEERREGETWYAAERSYGSFTRAFTLPEGVDSEHVTAELRDGVLTLRVPKRAEVQPRKIAVTGGTAPKSPGGNA